MLSFLKDNAAGNIVSDGLSEGGDDQGYLTIARHGKNLRQSTMLLAILFCVGALCV